MAKELDSIGFYSDLDIEKGLVKEVSLWNKFGYISGLASGSEVLLASFNANFVFKTSGEQLSIVSSSANDTNGGSGSAARITFRLLYYDSILNTIYETDRVILNTGNQNEVTFNNDHPGPYREKSAVYLTVESDTSGAFAFARIKGYIVKDSEYSSSDFVNQ